MTFIASVIAKKGVAIIADSLVTSQMPILHYNSFIKYLDNQPKNENGDTLIDHAEIRALFNHEPVFTKDYEEKLFQLNDYTAITTTGAAYINGKNIADIVEGFKGQQQDINDLAISFEIKLDQFSAFLNKEIREHLNKYELIYYTAFIVTYYERHTHKTRIFKVIINEANRDSLEQGDYNYVTLNQEEEWVKVVCDGQNKISDKVLYGIGKGIYQIFPDLVANILGKLTLPDGIIPQDFTDQLIEDPYFTDIFLGDIELLNLTDLSVQQAVDLASLLMRLEVDFQKYTKNIPTVGGVIKLAVIDEEGFRFISGHDIEPPKHINL